MLGGGVASIPVFLYIFPNSMPLVIIMVCSLIQVRYVKDKGSPLYLAVGWSFGAVGLVVSWLVSAWLFPSTINPVAQLNDFFGAIYTTILVTILFFGIGTSIVLARMAKVSKQEIKHEDTKKR